MTLKYLDGGRSRGIVHEGQLSKGLASFECAERFVVVLSRNENLRAAKTRNMGVEKLGIKLIWGRNV